MVSIVEVLIWYLMLILNTGFMVLNYWKLYEYFVILSSN